MNSHPFRKLSAVVAVVLLLLIVTSPVTTIWLIKHQADAIVSDSLRGLTSGSLASLNVSEGFLETALAVNGGAPQREQITRLLEQSTRRVDQAYNTYRDTLKGPAETAAFERMIRSRDAYRASRAKVVELLGKGDVEAAGELFDHECVRSFDAYTGNLSEVVEHTVREARIRGAQIVKLCYILLIIQILLFAFFFVYGFFVPLTAVLERLARRPIVYKT
ncbi:MAG: MCP four helix bundle domain-containing protein [Akkermansiaceae bacterium]|nr:MCP four helix bundle domain-containing protein [Akkermansiaceae bacterium]